MAAVRPAVRPFRPPPSRRPPPSGQQQQHQQYGPTVHAPLPPPPPLQAFSQLSLVMPLVPAAQQKWRQDLQRAVSAEEVAGAVAFAEFSAGETCDGCRARQFKFVDMGQPGAVHLHLLPCLHKFCDACCVVLASTHSVPTCSVCLEAFRIEVSSSTYRFTTKKKKANLIQKKDVWPSIRNLSQLTILCGKCMHMGFTTQPAHRVCTMCHHFYCTNHARLFFFFLLQMKIENLKPNLKKKRDHIASSLHNNNHLYPGSITSATKSCTRGSTPAVS